MSFIGKSTIMGMLIPPLAWATTEIIDLKSRISRVEEKSISLDERVNDIKYLVKETRDGVNMLISHLLEKEN